MTKGTTLCIQRSDAIRYAGIYLSQMGLPITEKPAPDVTNVLLPIPSFTTGDTYLAHILADLPEDVVLFGGNLTSALLENYAVVDFLQDPYYLAENAAITASCAYKIIKSKLCGQFSGKEILVTGWGRIAKCLYRLFDKEGIPVTVAARKDTDRAMIRALGGRSISVEDAAKESDRYDVIINTVPALIFPQCKVKETAIILELASKPGITGDKIIDGRGLPGKMAPRESGQLIAETFIRLSAGKDT